LIGEEVANQLHHWRLRTETTRPLKFSSHTNLKLYLRSVDYCSIYFCIICSFFDLRVRIKIIIIYVSMNISFAANRSYDILFTCLFTNLAARQHFVINYTQNIIVVFVFSLNIAMWLTHNNGLAKSYRPI